MTQVIFQMSTPACPSVTFVQVLPLFGQPSMPTRFPSSSLRSPIVVPRFTRKQRCRNANIGKIGRPIYDVPPFETSSMYRPSDASPP